MDSTYTISFTSFQELKELFNSKSGDYITICNPTSLKDLFIRTIQGQCQGTPSRLQERAWEQLLLNTGLSESTLYKTENVRRLVLGYKEEDFTVINRDQPFLETPQEGDSEVKRIIHYLLSDRDLSSSDISTKLLSATLLYKNEDFLAEAVEELQSIFQKLHTKLISNESPESKKAYEILLGNALALLPFFEPKKDSSIQVPQKLWDGWRLITYKIEPIALTPSWMGAPFYCYGLRADLAPPLLLLQGTTYPASSGSLWTYWTDVIPFTSVGELVYRFWGKEKIRAWLDRNWQRAHIYGQSLGGSLSIMTVCDHPEKISEVHAYGSPSPFFGFINTYREKVKTLEVPPTVNLYQQEGDLVPLLGWGWHEDWKISTIVAEKKLSPIPAHAKAFTAQKCFMIMNVKDEMQQTLIQRIAFNIFHLFISIPLSIIWTLIITVKALTIMPLYFALEAIYECSRSREAHETVETLV